mgnify:CR=1 FL=1
MNRRPTKLLQMLVSLLLTAGCATSPLGLMTEAPGDRDRTAKLEQVPVRGALTTVLCRTDHGVVSIAGELLAVEQRALWLVDRGAIVRLDRRCVTGAIIERHRSLTTNTAAWTFFGTLSTLGHGSWGGLTVPMWLLAGTAVTAGQAAGNDVQVLPHRVQDMWPFARFPAGRPPRYYPTAPAPVTRAVQYFRLGGP